MHNEQCPECGTELEVREVTPCIDCGALEDQVELLKQDIAENYTHDSVEFNVYRLFEKYEVTLCGFCAVDFGSYDPTYFGFPRNKNIGYEKMQFISAVREPKVGKDKYCPACKERLSFTKFLFRVRNENDF